MIKQLKRGYILGLIVMNLTWLNGAIASPVETESCNKCHGENGSSTDPDTPTIAGMSTTYILDTFYFYQQGERNHPKMKQAVDTLSDKKQQQLAEYYSSQKYTKVQQPFDNELANKGKQLHQMHCAICHEEAGTTAEDDAGFLSGQWQPYLALTIKDYRNGTRLGSKKMIEKLQSLNEQQIQWLLNYYASARN